MSKNRNEANDVSARRNFENQFLQGSALNHADVQFDPVESDRGRADMFNGLRPVVGGSVILVGFRQRINPFDLVRQVRLQAL